MNFHTRFLVLLFLSSFVAQTTFAQDTPYIPYRKGLLWGFADTSGNIVVTPEYKKKGEVEKNMFLFIKDRKKGVVTLDNKIVIPFSRHQISLTEHCIIQTIYPGKIARVRDGKKIKSIYYSITTGKKTFPENIEYVDTKELNDKTYFVVTTKSGKQGLAEVTENFDGIKTWHIDTSAIKIKPSFSFHYTIVEKDGVETKFAPGKTLEEINALIKTEAPIMEVPEEEISDAEDVVYKKPKPKKEYTLLQRKIGNEYQIVVQCEWVYQDRNKNSTVMDTLPQKYSSLDIFTGRNTFSRTDSIAHVDHQKYQQSIAFVKNKEGKEGLVNSFGELLIPIVYDSLSRDFLLENHKTIYLFALKNKKWGLINQDKNTLIPFEYDRLFLNSNAPPEKKMTFNNLGYSFKRGVIALKNGKYGVINSREKLADFKYDKIIYARYGFAFQLKKNNKYGLLQFKKHYEKGPDYTLTEPIFKIPINEVVEFAGYKVGEIRNERYKFVGFVDPKGFNYFED